MRNYINEHVAIKNGGRKAPKGGKEKLEEIFGSDYTVEEIFGKYKSLCKDIKDKIDLSRVIEDLDDSSVLRETSTGLSFITEYVTCTDGDKSPIEFLFFIYYDGKNFRGYVPIHGNTINATTREPFGFDDEKDFTYLKKYGYTNLSSLEEYSKTALDDLLAINEPECIKDFESRVEVEGSGEKAIDHLYFEIEDDNIYISFSYNKFEPTRNGINIEDVFQHSNLIPTSKTGVYYLDQDEEDDNWISDFLNEIYSDIEGSLFFIPGNFKNNEYSAFKDYSPDGILTIKYWFKGEDHSTIHFGTDPWGDEILNSIFKNYVPDSNFDWDDEDERYYKESDIEALKTGCTCPWIKFEEDTSKSDPLKEEVDHLYFRVGEGDYDAYYITFSVNHNISDTSKVREILQDKIPGNTLKEVREGIYEFPNSISDKCLGEQLHELFDKAVKDFYLIPGDFEVNDKLVQGNIIWDEKFGDYTSAGILEIGFSHDERYVGFGVDCWETDIMKELIDNYVPVSYGFGDSDIGDGEWAYEESDIDALKNDCRCPWIKFIDENEKGQKVYFGLMSNGGVVFSFSPTDPEVKVKNGYDVIRVVLSKLPGLKLKDLGNGSWGIETDCISEDLDCKYWNLSDILCPTLWPAKFDEVVGDGLEYNDKEELVIYCTIYNTSIVVSCHPDFADDGPSRSMLYKYIEAGLPGLRLEEEAECFYTFDYCNCREYPSRQLLSRVYGVELRQGAWGEDHLHGPGDDGYDTPEELAKEEEEFMKEQEEERHQCGCGCCHCHEEEEAVLKKPATLEEAIQNLYNDAYMFSVSDGPIKPLRKSDEPQEKVDYDTAMMLVEVGYYEYKTNPLNGCTEEEYNTLPESSKPTYIEAWLWLWRVKGIKLNVSESLGRAFCFGGGFKSGEIYSNVSDPEDAIKRTLQEMSKGFKKMVEMKNKNIIYYRFNSNDRVEFSRSKNFDSEKTADDKDAVVVSVLKAIPVIQIDEGRIIFRGSEEKDKDKIRKILSKSIYIKLVEVNG